MRCQWTQRQKENVALQQCVFFADVAEFAYNSSPHSVTKLSPMFAMYGFEPRGIQIREEEEVASPAAEEWLDRMTAVHNQILTTLRDVNNRRINTTTMATDTATTARANTTKVRTNRVGDQVLVNRRNLTILGGVRSLLDK